LSAAEELPAHQPHCFACGVDNPTGLPLRFRREGERVRTEVSFDRDHSGAIEFAHGGAIATVLDDTIGTLLMAVVDQVGVTARLEVDYIAPVPLGVPLEVVAWIDSQEARKVFTTAELRRGPDPLARAAGLFIVVDDDHFPDGGANNERWRRLRGGDPGLSR
jgi:acyl-coenzyme A thioesterase PaaI-like protein